MIISKELQSNISKRPHTADYPDAYWATFDLGCSSALISSGFELVSLDKTNPKKARLIFRREPGIEKVVDDYFSNRLEVKARTFFDNIKAIKNRIYCE